VRMQPFRFPRIQICRAKPPPPTGLWFLLPFGTSGGFFIRRSLLKTPIKIHASAAGVGFDTTFSTASRLCLAER